MRLTPRSFIDEETHVAPWGPPGRALHHRCSASLPVPRVVVWSGGVWRNSVTLGRLTTSLSSAWRAGSLVWVFCGCALLSGPSCSLCSGELWGAKSAFPAASGSPQPPPMGIRRWMSSPCTRPVQLVNTLRGPGAPAGTPPSCAALEGSPEVQGCQRLPSALLRKWGPWGCARVRVLVGVWVCMGL